VKVEIQGRRQKAEGRNRRHCRTGGAVLEMVLVLPILLALAFGTVEFGYFFYVKSNVQSAAREGARAAILPSSTSSDVNTAIANAMSAAGLSSSGYTTSIMDANGAAVTLSSVAAGTAIKVTVQCNWSTVGIRPLGLISAGKVIVGATTMRKES
jgi:Flp pilus assembly protein TadG